MVLCRGLVYQLFLLFFFFNDTATTEIYTLSLHDALPILHRNDGGRGCGTLRCPPPDIPPETDRKSGSAGMPRPISYAVFCLKKKHNKNFTIHLSSPTPHIHFTTSRRHECQRALQVPYCECVSEDHREDAGQADLIVFF